jgi:DNA-directed RNA polymerase subunit RPC12/RpoP
LRCRPFVVRPWHQRLFHFFCQRLFYYRYQPITFSCPRCSQGLRIPKAHPKLTVRCPNCDSRFLCYS